MKLLSSIIFNFILIFGLNFIFIGTCNAGGKISVNVKNEGLLEFDGTSAPYKSGGNSIDIMIKMNCASVNTRDNPHILGGNTAIPFFSVK